jgi:hypothetical protein
VNRVVDAPVSSFTFAVTFFTSSRIALIRAIAGAT